MSRCRKGNFVERAAGNCARRARQQAIRSTYVVASSAKNLHLYYLLEEPINAFAPGLSESVLHWKGR